MENNAYCNQSIMCSVTNCKHHNSTKDYCSLEAIKVGTHEANPKTNRKNAGFTDEERSKMTALLDDGFIDTYRYFYPDTEGVYSWWSYRFKAREKNAGWRIDYFIVSKALESKLDGAKIHTEILGSDHCPVELTIDI